MGNHVLEYVIKATDKTAGAVMSATSRLRKFASTVASVMAGAGRHFASFAATVGRNLANVKAGLDMAVGAVSGFVRQFTGAIAEAFRFEKAVANFKTLLGSIDAAKLHIEDLRKFAAATPLTFDDLQQASKLMLSFGMSIDTIMPNLKMLGDIAMGDRVKFQGLALVFSQIKAAGRLMGQDLLQMINQGFNPLTIIAEKTGASMVELKKLMEQGAIGFDMVEAAMKSATSEGGRFNNAMKDCATTSEGLMSTLQDNWTDAVRTFGNELMDVAKGGIQWCINKLQELRESGAIQEWADKAKTAIYSVIGAFNGLSDASTRAEVWGALKDIVIGGFEEAATGAAKILIKAAKVVGSVIQKGLELTVKDFAIGQSAEKDVFNKWKKQGRVKAAGLNLLGNDEFKADVEKQKQHIKDTLMRQETERAKKAAGFGDENGAAGESRLERGLRILSEFGNQAVKAANEIGSTTVTSTAKNPGTDKPADLNAMLDNARTAGSNDTGKQQREAELQAEAAARAQEKADREVARQRQKAWDEYVRNMEKDLRRAEQVRDDANERLNAAKSYSAQAWGFYRDPESLKAYDAEQDANMAAREQYAKDYKSLTHGVNADRFSHLKYLARHNGTGAVEEQLAEWRKKKTISLDTEAAMRVGVADDQERLAYKYAEETAKNTAQMAASLKEITEGGVE